MFFQAAVNPKITLSPFRPEDQTGVKALILGGLAEHWGTIDPNKNPDLNDIASAYAGATFLVARLEGRVVGTGALLPRLQHTAEIVRMSVAADLRRQGLGKRILSRLIEDARTTGYRQVILETTQTWSEVIQFYLDNGFRITHFEDGDVYFEMALDQ
jgi:putative acetyltransferase